MTETRPAAVEIHAETDQLATVDPSQPITNLRHGVLLCDQLSRSDLVPRGLQGKPANIFIVIMAGQEIGLTWPVSLRMIYSPGPGQIGMRGELLLAKLHEAGHEYEWEEVAGESCTFRLERYAGPARKARHYEATFTIEDAIQAGLAKRNTNGEVVALSRENKPLPWMQYSADMLFWRAVSRCVKRAAPEILMGFEVQGADDRVENAVAEVELKPASQVPSGPEAERASEEQLRILDERMRQEAGEPARPEGLIEGSGRVMEPRAMDSTLHSKEELEAERAQVTGNVGGSPYGTEVPVEDPEAPDWSQSPEVRAELTAYREEAEARREQEDSAAEEPPADKAKGQVLAERFEALGWHPRKHRADLVRACSVFLRRPVTGSRDMSTAETMGLVAELGGIQRSFPAEQHPVALAERVELWREQWAEADPESYREYAGE
jgi:hypothetical protein